MGLKFIGNGSCFNVKNGNTSAYYYNKRKGILFLIDCGESVFEKLVNKIETEFKNLDQVIVVITHFHSDHIGSLPSLIFYLNIAKGIVPKVIFPEKSIIELLTKMGVEESCYEYKKTCEVIDTQVKVLHKGNLDSFGYVFNICGRKLYYSGDSKELPKSILTRFLDREIDIIYHDMTRYIGTGHASVNYLSSIIPKKLRNKVYAMHLDDKETEKLALLYEFKIAK